MRNIYSDETLRRALQLSLRLVLRRLRLCTSPERANHSYDHLLLMQPKEDLIRLDLQANGTNSPIQSFINSAIAYANITDLLGDWAPTLHQEVTANMTSFSQNRFYNPSSDPTVTAGYEAIYQANANMMLTQIGQVELLLSLTGTAQGGPGSFAVQAALQHPFSQGQLYIKTSNPFDYPVIDPNYFSHPAGTS